jgi:WD40 repeat protein
MRRTLPSLAALLLLTRCLAATPALAADAPPAGGRRPLAKLAGPAGTDVAFSRDGKLILTAGGDSARVWDARTYEPVTPPLVHAKGEAIVRAALAPDGRLALTVAAGEARLWDVESRRPLHVLRHGEAGGVTFAAFNPDGSVVVTCGSDNAARLWDVRGANVLHVLKHEAPVKFAAFDPAGDRVVTVSDSWVTAAGGHREKDGERHDARVWEVRSGKGLGSYPADVSPSHEGPTRRPAAFLADGGRVISIDTWIAFVWDATTGAYVSEVDGRAEYLGWELGAASVFAVAPDGRRLAVAGSNAAGVWDVRAGLDAKRPLAVFRISGIEDVQFSPDGGRILIATDTDESGVWDVASGRQLLSLRPPRREPLPKRSRSPQPSLYDWRNWLVPAQAVTEVPAVAFSPDGRRVAAGFASDGYTAVWEVPGAKGP